MSKRAFSCIRVTDYRSLSKIVRQHDTSLRKFSRDNFDSGSGQVAPLKYATEASNRSTPTQIQSPRKQRARRQAPHNEQFRTLRLQQVQHQTN